MLKMSYHEANEGDHDKIMELKKAESRIYGVKFIICTTEWTEDKISCRANLQISKRQ